MCLLSLYNLHLLVVVCVHLFWSFIGVFVTGHLLSHHLLESAVISSFSKFESLFGLGFFLLSLHSFDLVNVRF